MSHTSPQYAALAQDAYNARQRGDIVPLNGVNYEVLKHVDRGGYQGTIYKREDTGEIVVAHRGTEPDRQLVRDGYTDARMVFDRVNNQADDAIALTRDARRFAELSGQSPNSVTVTGHSLGGTLAQISAHHYDLRGETFNAYGAASLNLRIPASDTPKVTNHVMAGDVVSAGSPHYGQVKVYAEQKEIDVMRDKGYENTRSGWDARNPVGVAANLAGGAHAMSHFSDPQHSVLTDPKAQQLARDYDPMIDKFRGDIGGMRRGLTIGTRGLDGLRDDLIDGIRGPLPAGEPGRREEARGRPHAYNDAPESIRANPGAGARFGAGNDDPNAMLDRMLAAAQSGDRDGFRQATQTAAAAEPGRNLREEAIAGADRQEQQALAQQSQHKQQAEQQDTPSRGPRMV